MKSCLENDYKNSPKSKYLLFTQRKVSQMNQKDAQNAERQESNKEEINQRMHS